MKTGKIVGYVIVSDLVLTLLLEDGTEVEVRVDSETALILGDDIMHGLYTGTDDEGRYIRKITRTIDSAGHFSEGDDDIEYEPEEVKE